MITILVAVAMQAAVAAEPRKAYSACLSQAVASAKTANVPAAGFKAYAHQTCAAVEDSFRKALAAFNIKNGMGRKTATEDAQVQIDDYVYTADDRYRYSVESPQ